MKAKTGGQQRLMTAANLAKFLDVCEHTVYRWCKTRRIPHYNLNSSYRFDAQEIKDWLARNHRQQTGADAEGKKRKRRTS